MLHNFIKSFLLFYATQPDLEAQPPTILIRDRDCAVPTNVLCNAHMSTSTSKARAAEVRTDKHRKTHSLVQTWVSHEMRKALDALAKKEGRTLANYVRRELGKISGVPE
jgi:hypothetical protein